jgi:hypothetical protein
MNIPKKVTEMRAMLIEMGCKEDKIINLGKIQTRELLESMIASTKAIESTGVDVTSATEEMTKPLAPEIDGIVIPQISNEGDGPVAKGVAPIDVEAVQDQVMSIDVPIMYTPEWTTYVLSHLTEKEKVSEYPKADGLRRIANNIFGPIDIATNIIHSPSSDNDRAVVVCTIQAVVAGRRVSVQGAADSNRNNTPYEFFAHSVSTAETRAEGKTLKKLLGLTGIYTIEELSNADTIPENDDDVTIQSGMLSGLLNGCFKDGIELSKLMAYAEIDVVNPREMTKKQGKDLIAKLNEFRTSGIPDQIKKAN